MEQRGRAQNAAWISGRCFNKSKGHGLPCPYNSLGRAKGRLGFLGLAAEECWHVEVVGGNFVADVPDVLLDLMDHVGQRLLLGPGLLHLATGFPRFGQEGRLLGNVFLVGFLEACGNHGDFHGVFHRVIHNRTKNDVGVFMRGLLDH